MGNRTFGQAVLPLLPFVFCVIAFGVPTEQPTVSVPASPNSEVKPAPSPQKPTGPETVYVTKTGKKYHTGSCSYLAKSKIATTLKDAVAGGYTPCSVCSPPIFTTQPFVAPQAVTAPKQTPLKRVETPPATTPLQVNSVPQTQAPTKYDTVYVTKTGQKFHRAGCRYLAKSQLPISRADAEAKGYSACSVCKP